MAFANKEKQLASQRKWYANNKAKQKNWVKDGKKRTAKWLQEYKASHPCTRCGENEPCCLDFHHPGQKDYNVAKMATNGMSTEKILEEIKKCVVLCSNCHRKTHAGVV